MTMMLEPTLDWWSLSTMHHHGSTVNSEPEDSLQKELEWTEQALLLNQQHQEHLESTPHQTSEQELNANELLTAASKEEPAAANDNLAATNPWTEMAHIEATTQELELVHDMTHFLRSSTASTSSGGLDDDESSPASVWKETSQCIRLAQVLQRHVPTTPRPNGSYVLPRLWEPLFSDEYLPWFEYLHSMLIWEFRQQLRRSGYPQPMACGQLLQECDTGEGRTGTVFHSLAETAHQLSLLRSQHKELIHLLQQTVPGILTGSSAIQHSFSTGEDPLVLELCRPFVERIRYHFVDDNGPQDEQQQESRSTRRTDRLPEWLFQYLRRHIFEAHEANNYLDDNVAVISNEITSTLASPWDLVHMALTPYVRSDLSLDFLNETIRMVQWVFNQRQFFRDAQIAGPRSQPLLLLNAVEQLLVWDDFCRTLRGNSTATLQQQRILSLMDIYVAGDNELFHWWLERERENIFGVLFAKDPSGNGSKSMLAISPRGELFASLLRSIRHKSSVFSYSGPYLHHVAAPLCMRFLDAIHEKAHDLHQGLLPALPTAGVLAANIQEWVQLINGSHKSALILVHEDVEDAEVDGPTQDPSLSSQEDLVRFGRSLQRLRGVLVQEFAKTFVETLLLERAKLAVYLMRSAHLFAVVPEEEESTTTTIDLSHDLADAQYVLDIFLHQTTHSYGSLLDALPVEKWGAGGYAPRALRDAVLTHLSEKFLEVALDWNGTVPDILHAGGCRFAADVRCLFGDNESNPLVALPPMALRLLDVCQCLCMDSMSLSGLGDAMVGLAGHPAEPLTDEMFAVDERLFEEALSMLRAKNLLWLDLNDFLSILNRRRDLTHSAFL